LTLAQQLGGPVLELGCGTGRYTIPLAEQGVDITGLDLAPAMLTQAKIKAPTQSIRWVLADARSFHLGRKFSLIFESGGMFQHLLERVDQEQMLACVDEHLTDEGRFVVTLPIYSAEWTTTVTEEQLWFTYTLPSGTEVRVSGTQHYDPVRQVKLETAYRRWRTADGQEVVKVAPLSLRQTFPAEMEALLCANGFELLQRYGGFDFRPFDSASSLMICVCRKAARS
jgi:SAM-dependent methyltransferase